MIKKDKFGINRTEKGKKKRFFEGILFDSELELKYYRDYLLPLKNKGEIKEIILQPKYILQKKYVKYKKTILPINYVADFQVEYSNGNIIVIDVKGLSTETAKIKRKMFDYIYPDKVLKWISYSMRDGGWIDYDELQKLRRERNKGLKS